MILILVAMSTAGTVAGQPAAKVGAFAFTFEHQPASEAMVLVRGLLSPSGTAELQSGGNTVLVRDQREVLERVADVLARFDHPPHDIRFDVHLLRAGAPGPREKSAPAGVLRILKQHLRYDEYALLGTAGFTSIEGGEVTYALGDDYDVTFRLGTMLAGQKIKLHDFRITQRAPRLTAASANKSRQPDARELVRTHLNLWRDKQFALVLSDDGRPDDALLVAITFRPEAP